MFRSACILGVVTCLTVGSAEAADPPAEKSPLPTKSDKPDESRPKRPTSKEEFAALAKEGPLPPWQPALGRSRVHDQRIDGTVVDVSADFIEIRLKDKNETVKYPAYTLLITGAVCHWQTDCDCYLLDDVKKGDVVIVGVGIPEMGADTHCFFVSIRERPGGKVPASRKPSEYNLYHIDQEKELAYRKKLAEEKKQTAPPPKTAAKDDKPAKEEKRPTTTEEFAALAKEGPKPLWLPIIGQNRVKDTRVHGTVVSVSREAIEVLPEGEKEAVKYPPHVLLDTGAVCHWETESRCYLLDDVQKGDVVMLGVGITEPGGETLCFYISILKRPGGGRRRGSRRTRTPTTRTGRP
ncbi:MAG: hypothetical protein MUF18_02880 [Fimbriiglobus sp.]|jgi:hypothetical protein|nr:hypothetical protein [Fimbriiglobus sp.]